MREGGAGLSCEILWNSHRRPKEFYDGDIDLAERFVAVVVAEVCGVGCVKRSKSKCESLA